VRFSSPADVALRFERAHPAFRRVPGPPAVASEAGFVRLWPHRHGTDGSFAAIWSHGG